jgi:hypothetical protein
LIFSQFWNQDLNFLKVTIFKTFIVNTNIIVHFIPKGFKTLKFQKLCMTNLLLYLGEPLYWNYSFKNSKINYVDNFTIYHYTYSKQWTLLNLKTKCWKHNINTSNAHNLKIIIIVVHETTMKAHRKNKREWNLDYHWIWL